MLLSRGASVDDQPQGGGTPLERLISFSAFHDGHFESARLLVDAGANTTVAQERLKDRLDDPGPGGFGFSNRPCPSTHARVCSKVGPRRTGTACW